MDGGELLFVAFVRFGLLRGGLRIYELFDLLASILARELSLDSLPSFLDLAST